MVYDVALGHVVAFDLHSVVATTWVWNRTSWSWTSGLGFSPEPSAIPDTAYDPRRRDVVLFSAATGTWTFNGTSWANTCPITCANPAINGGAAIVYDPTAGRVVLFGGTTSAGRYQDGTWLWDGSSWASMSPPRKPSPRAGAAMAYDRACPCALLFGGAGPDGTMGDLWQWHSGGWSLASAASRPSLPPPAPLPIGDGHSLPSSDQPYHLTTGQLAHILLPTAPTATKGWSQLATNQTGVLDIVAEKAGTGPFSATVRGVAPGETQVVVSFLCAKDACAAWTANIVVTP